jgi:hypothetical protein
MFANWEPDNYLTLISIIIIVIGGGFTLFQWNSSEKFKRVKYLEEIITKLRFDPEMANTLYIIEYEHNWYTEKFHNDHDFEYKIDKVLSYFDFICYLYITKIIKDDEFKILKYRINKICNSPSVQKYLCNLFHYSKSMGADCSFTHIIDYGIKNKIIKKEFKDNNND